MDMYNNNPLQTVHLVSIFSYLNKLSDFLFIENYLTETNQTRQIPIVNALYEYLEHYRDNQTMKIKLVRSLLKGSDLYGEQDNENPDSIFVNTMFDYIITSLVFDKYGNIYGFLADVFRKAENLRIDYILSKTKETLENTIFENEYGDSSFLSNLSINRIYNDIILPIFPQPKTNLSLLSLDYIYALAGSTFLRPSRVNATYYHKNDIDNTNINDEFDEYVAMGLILENLLVNEKINFLTSKAFALPALANYVSTEKILLKDESTINIVSDSLHWEKAYHYLFKYIDKILEKIQSNLSRNYIFQMHEAFSNFQSRASLTKKFLDTHCSSNKDWSEYFNNQTALSQCGIEHPPNLNKQFLNQIKKIIKIYKRHSLRLMRKAFGKSLIESLNSEKTIIKLLSPYDKVEFGNLSESVQLPYDVFEVFFTNYGTYEYYALIHENYNMTLINEAEDPIIFRNKIGSSLEEFRNRSISIILKQESKTINIFLRNLIKHKTKRLRTYLLNLEVNLGNKNESWKNEWWKEFGLSLMIHYPCLLDINSCAKNKIQFSKEFQRNMSSKAVHINKLFSSLGTNVGNLFLRNATNESIREITGAQKKYSINVSSKNVFNHINLHINEPAFVLTALIQDEIILLETIIGDLKEKTGFNFPYIERNLHDMSILKSNIFISVGVAGVNRNRLIYVNTLNNKSDTGYGYKFIHLSEKPMDIAQLRTDYEFKKKRFISKILDWDKSEKKYVRLNNQSLEIEPDDIVYEVNEQIRKKLTKLLFSAISVHHDDKCTDVEYFEKSKKLNACLRQRRLKEKTDFEMKAIKYIEDNTDLPRDYIIKTFRKYTFPDSTALSHFVKNWVNNKNFKEPSTDNEYLIDNPDLLNYLRYHSRLENHTVSDYDGRLRINFIYSQKERQMIEDGTSIEIIIKDYNEQKAVYSTTFDDYYAIRNYATTGYRRITRDTSEAKLMKIALYKLAIRQSEDSRDEFELKLFRIESKPIEIVNQTCFKKDIILQKFTTVSTSAASAVKFAAYAEPGFRNVIYEMIFYGPYVRAKIEQFYTYNEKMVILLPGTEFSVMDCTSVSIGGLGSVLKVKLKFKHNLAEKSVWYKNIVNQIARNKL